jgi:UPF0716 protein FxsA
MLVLVPIGVALLEVFVFIEVAHAIGWLAASVLLLATSVLGAQLLIVQGRSAIDRVSLAVSRRGASARAVTEGALGILGCVLLVIPGFVTDALGALLILPPTRRAARRWLSLHYAARLTTLVTAVGRFRSSGSDSPPADFESTAHEDDPSQIGR